MDLKLYVIPSEHKTQEVDGEVKIVVTEKGKPLSNPISFGVDIKQYLLGSDLVKNQEEDAVSFVIIEEGNDYWNKRKDEIPPKDYWKEIPIYLKVKTAEGTEEIVALLNKYNSDESINPESVS